MSYHENLLACIGNTPLVRLNSLSQECGAEIWGKAEMLNPGGSVKDRIALAMVETAEREGRLRAGDTMVEATAGNTGVGLAMVAAIRGYRCVFVMPEKMSRDKDALLRAYGAEVVRVPNAPPGDPQNFQEVAKRLAQERGWFLTEQFSNPANPDIHYQTTGPEIWRDTQGEVAALVCGVGTGGSLTGAGRFLKERNPELLIALAEPEGSALGGGEAGAYLMEGIGGNVTPANLDPALVDEAIYVSDKQAFQMARRLARREGILAGGTAGCAAVAALELGRRAEFAKKIIVAILPDTGRNYFSKIFDDDWMREQGFGDVL